MIVARRVVNHELYTSDFVFFITYLAQVSPLTWDDLTIIDTRAALWSTQYAWINLPIYKPIACGCRKATRASQ